MSSARVESSLNRMSLQNQKIVKPFLEDRKANGASENTLRAYAGWLLQAERRGPQYKTGQVVPFTKWTKQHCRELLAGIKNQNSRNSLGILLKTFIRSLGKEDVMAWWKPKQRTLAILLDSVPNDEEIKAILKAIPDMKYRSFFHVVADSGARVGEILGLKVHQVSFDELGAIIILPTSKTGAGLRLRLVSSAPILRDWLNHFSAPPDGRVWQMSYSSANRQFRAAVKKAEIKKPLTIHSLRHAKATQMARSGMNEQLMRQHFGWQPGSRMTERYTHLTGTDLDNAVLKANGVVRPVEPPSVGLKAITCPICKATNDPTYSFCVKCSASLTSASVSVESAADVCRRLLEDFDFPGQLESAIEDFQKQDTALDKYYADRKKDYPMPNPNESPTERLVGIILGMNRILLDMASFEKTATIADRAAVEKKVAEAKKELRQQGFEI